MAASTTLEKLTDLRQEVEARLQDNEDFRTYLALTRAIADISGGGFDARLHEPVQGQDQTSRKNGESIDVSSLSQADAAQVLLTKVLREPVLIANLVTALTAHGVTVGGNNPNVNLSSTLSRDGRFRSVRYKDRMSWWVKGTPFPGELDAR
jgi:hypothetical protein